MKTYETETLEYSLGGTIDKLLHAVRGRTTDDADADMIFCLSRCQHALVDGTRCIQRATVVEQHFAEIGNKEENFPLVFIYACDEHKQKDLVQPPVSDVK
jgi:hypothetical protein